MVMLRKKEPGLLPKSGEGSPASIAERLAAGKGVRLQFGESWRLRVDRPLPFLCVVRGAPEGLPPGTDQLIIGEASWLLAPGREGSDEELRRLVRALVQEGSEEFGAYLLLEIWIGEGREQEGEERVPARPGFTIVTSKRGWPQRTVDRLSNALKKIRLDRMEAEVSLSRREIVAPPGRKPLLSARDYEKLNCWRIGLEVDPVFLNPETGELYPQRLRRLRRSLGRALRMTWHEFIRTQTDRRPPHFQALGPRAVTRAVWEVDRRLAEIDSSFSLLLDVTPVNQRSAYQTFLRQKEGREPTFLYRPLEIDPDRLRRRLFQVPIEKIEDPTLAELFREKQEELDRQIVLLRDRQSISFQYAGLQLYGRPEQELVELASSLLEKLAVGREEEPARGRVNAEEFAAMARSEFEHYRSIYPEFQSSATVREDIAQGLMVNSGDLLVGSGTSIPRRRANALLQHEVGTHVLTYVNGGAQPLRQLRGGLAGYDEFQEGTAVLAEYLVGGLTRARLRLLAVRVIGVDAMLRGADFLETYRLLTEGYRFSRSSAFTITMRIYRGGGFPKDAVYLRGFQSVISYLRDGGVIDYLFVGKLSRHHIPIIRELQYRNVLKAAPLSPRYLNNEPAQTGLQKIRGGYSVLDIAEEIS